MRAMKALAIAILLAGAVPALAESSADPAAIETTCEASMHRRPRDAFDCECLRAEGVPATAAGEVRDRLRAWARENPGDPWIAAALASFAVERPGGDVKAHIDRAIEGFRAAGRADGEAYVLSLLVRHHQRFRRKEESRAGWKRLEEMAAALDDPIVDARLTIVRAQAALEDSQVDVAYLEMRGAVSTPAFPGLPPPTQRYLLKQTANNALQLGRYSEALRHARLAGQGCPDPQSCADYELFFRARAARYMAIASLAPQDEAASLTRQAYERARARGSRWAEMLELCELGHWTEPPESLTWFSRCAELAPTMGCDDIGLIAKSLYTVGIARDDPSKLSASLATMEEIVHETARLGIAAEEIAAHGFLAGLHRQAEDRDGALAALRRAVSLAERHQERQLHAESGAGLVTFEAKQFHTLASFLALESPASDRAALEEAYGVLERYRLRAAMNDLRRAEIAPEPASEPEAKGLRSRLTDARDSISRVQGELRSTGLEATRRGELLRELERHEAEEQASIRELARLDPASVAFERPRVATLEQVQAALARDEALIAFQLTATPLDDPWALVVARDTAAAVPLPAAGVEAAMGLYLGLVARRDGAEVAAADRLSSALLEPVLARLGPEVSRLIVVPDGQLYRIPMAALPVSPGGHPLALRFELALVSSATQFVEARRGPQAALPRAALAVAGSSQQTKGIPSWFGEVDSLRFGLSQGLPLPNARAETLGVVKALGGHSRALHEERASETSLKRTDLVPYGVLHLAVHAVSNQDWPARSAVLLPARARDDDGLLQPREIAQLDLDGTLVVLAACDSASGQNERGGSPLSLARAFLSADAPAVIGTLWPVWDDEAARFAERFYARLTVGDTAAGALTATQRSMIQDGMPAAAWSAYVLIGAGDVRLAAAEKGRLPAWGSAVGVGSLAALLLAFLVFRALTRSHRSESPSDRS